MGLLTVTQNFSNSWRKTLEGRWQISESFSWYFRIRTQNHCLLTQWNINAIGLPLSIIWVVRANGNQSEVVEEEAQTFSIFSCPEQLNRWPCHSLTHWLTNSTFTFDIQRAILETCDHCDIWSDRFLEDFQIFGRFFSDFWMIFRFLDDFWMILDDFWMIFWMIFRF